ncbi:MAG: hypothetical protein IPL46_05700 [Saprospiraceae bacterium]|nr:hypothetical protein [Saprospiraceae bacterium]
MTERMPGLVDYFMEQNISSAWALVEAENFRSGVLTCMQGLKASFFTPNTLFLSLTDEADGDEDIRILMDRARQYGFGSYLYLPYKKVGLGLEKTINLWLDLHKLDLDLGYKVEDVNLGILTAYLLRRNWKGRLNINVCVDDERMLERAKVFIVNLTLNARLPKAETYYHIDLVEKGVLAAPNADLNILSLRHDQINIKNIRQLVEDLGTSCLFTLDGGNENALA